MNDSTSAHASGSLSSFLSCVAVNEPSFFFDPSIIFGCEDTRSNMASGPCLYMKTGRYSPCVSFPLVQSLHPFPPHSLCVTHLCENGILNPLPRVFLSLLPYTDKSTISFQSLEPYTRLSVTMMCSLRAIAESLLTGKSGQLMCTPVLTKSPTGLGFATETSAFFPPYLDTLSQMTLHTRLISSIVKGSSSL